MTIILQTAHDDAGMNANALGKGNHRRFRFKPRQFTLHGRWDEQIGGKGVGLLLLCVLCRTIQPPPHPAIIPGDRAYTAALSPFLCNLHNEFVCDFGHIRAIGPARFGLYWVQAKALTCEVTLIG